jgi:hypothetical protein
MTDNTLKENKDCGKKVIKKAHRISDKTLVIIDEAIINRLGIDKENTWVEEVVTDHGILLKICNNNINAGGSSR